MFDLGPKPVGPSRLEGATSHQGRGALSRGGSRRAVAHSLSRIGGTA